MSTLNFHTAASGAVLNTNEAPEVMTQGGDWVNILNEIEKISSKHIVVSMGPVHPSTHGVPRLILGLDGEIVREIRVDTGYLHTGIEKTMEYRIFIQGTTLCTRMDYVAPFFQEAVYCFVVEKLLGIIDSILERASFIRVMMMELSRIASRLAAIGSTGNETGTTTIMTIAFRGREEILRIFERITGLRVNRAYIRSGGVVQDIGEGTIDYIRELLPKCRHDIGELEDLTCANPAFKKRLCDVAVMPLSAFMALSTMGPGVRAAGFPMDLRKSQPCYGYEVFDLDIPIVDQSDVYNRTMVRFDERYQSLRIIYQILECLEKCEGAPVMVIDPTIARPAQFSVASDGQGNSLGHICEVMGSSMKSLIHHFKFVAEGFTVPAGQVYQTVEHVKGVLGVRLVSDGETRPFRAHFRGPSSANLQALAMMTGGDQLADVVVSPAAIDPVLGGVDR